MAVTQPEDIKWQDKNVVITSIVKTKDTLKAKHEVTWEASFFFLHFLSFSISTVYFLQNKLSTNNHANGSWLVQQLLNI